MTKRRTPAPKADRERARRAGEHADVLLEATWGADATDARAQRHGGYHTYAYAYALIEDIRAAADASEVAADAFEETRQVRPLEKYRKRADDLRKTLSMHEHYVAYRPYDTGTLRSRAVATRRDPSDHSPRMSSHPPSRPPSRPSSRPPSSRPRSSEGNENLAYLLDRDVRAIGPERAAAPPAPDIRLLISPYGSYRYVGLENGRPVSALQIISRDGGVRGTIANVYTTPFARRRGWAARLLEAARRQFREVKHSDDLSPAGSAWKGSVRDPETARRRALSLHADASQANHRLSTDRHRYHGNAPAKDPKRWHTRVATLAREASDLWAVTADAYEEAGDIDEAELAHRRSHALHLVAVHHQRLATGPQRDAPPRRRGYHEPNRRDRDPGGEEEAASWPLDEALLRHHIDAAERAEVDADLEETHGNLREARARAREAGAHYYAAADVAAVPTVHNRADLHRLEERIALLKLAWRSFRRGRSYSNAEQVQRLIENLTSFQARLRGTLRP